MKKIYSLLLVSALALMTGCNRTEPVTPTPPDGDEVTISIKTTGIEEYDLPILKSGETVLAVQVYRSESGANQYSPCAYGLFSDWSNLAFTGIKGKDYKLEATLVVNASENIQKTGDVYGLPLGGKVENKFNYETSALAGIAKSEATLADGKNYEVPVLDRYFGTVSKNIASKNESITLNMKRVSFGIQNKLEDAVKESLVITLEGAPAVELSPANASDITVFSFKNIVAAYNADETSAPYSETIQVSVNVDGENMFSGDVAFKRNKLSVITIDGSGNVNIGVEVEVPFEKETVVSDNLYYNEFQLNTEQKFWVVLGDYPVESDNSHVKWYVNGELKGSGDEFSFKPAAAGEYIIKYIVNGKKSKSAVVKFYSSTGVYILNEPNMSAAENIRGVNMHTFGTSTVERFIQGDYNSFGTTNQYLANWAGHIYNVAPYGQSGVAFSQFKDDGTFVKAVKTIGSNGSAYAFAGITPETGVVTTSVGAYLVNLADFTLNSSILVGSEGSKTRNVFVSDGYLFMITASGAVAYDIDKLTTDEAPVVLGSATAGFVKTKDGYIWAANGTTLLRIDPKDLSATERTLPDGAKIAFSSGPWKQCSWVASTAENVFFFLKDSWGTGREVYKYNVDTEALTTKFIDASVSLDNYMLYSTCLYYDSQRNELICQTLKGYGADGAYSGIHMFNATTGVKNYEVLYNTAVEGFGATDMWFPAMMAPIKNY